MKKKIIIWAVVLLVLSFIFSLLFYRDLNPIKISAVNLAKEYSENKSQADQKYLDNKIVVTGTVKAIYRLLGTRRVLEFNTGDSTIPVICFFMDEHEDFVASQLQQDQNIEITGKCVGEDAYSFVKGIKIEVSEIKE